MRNAFNPYGGVNPLIDKMIGNAYDIVKYVAKYLKEIRYVAENMQYVYAAANGSKTYLPPHINDGGGLTFNIAAPVGYDYSSLRSVDVIALANDGKVYFPGENTFTFLIDFFTGQVVVTTEAGLPILESATFMVTFTSNALPVVE